MNDKWHLNVWGVRGSFPTPAAEYLEYGGNTSCISVTCDKELIVFDAGSGLAVLSASLPPIKRIHLFLSHFHLDHVMGLFLFPHGIVSPKSYSSPMDSIVYHSAAVSCNQSLKAKRIIPSGRIEAEINGICGENSDYLTTLLPADMTG